MNPIAGKAGVQMAVAVDTSATLTTNGGSWIFLGAIAVSAETYLG